MKRYKVSIKRDKGEEKINVWRKMQGEVSLGIGSLIQFDTDLWRWVDVLMCGFSKKPP